MKTTLLYGKEGLTINVPDDSVIVVPNNLEGLENEEKAVIEALRNPIGSKPLHEMVKETDKVAIVISDITRPTPNHKLVPWLIKELPHVPLNNFVIINGTGTHRDQTRDEFVQMLGEWVVDNVRVINNSCHDKETLVNVGESKFGCDIYLNKEYVEADFRIVTGFIEPHFFAGFSGGPKGIMPGIAGIETIMTFHNARMIGDPLSTWGNMVNNPVQDMTREVNSYCKPHFMLNVTLNKAKQITNVFAGELYEAHDEGCAYVKEHSMIKCDDRFDVVITSNSGYPLDQNLYQAVKGMSAAHKIVKKGGTIICAAECSDGLPNHGNYAEILRMRKTPQEILDMINDPEFKMFDQWQVQKQAVIQVWADVFVYSTLSDEDVNNAMFTSTKDIDRTLEELKESYGEDMKVAVLPLGPLTIPYVEE
ncbi:nickel-dependent lactate racemase [Metabacillus sediminilitoris]|uniref:Nickel-dependent lactate racemase n=1 Tax=Metabacillus sediminilitoris TaxID=2567941 RepID=A0A4V3WF85_9BACI|nr:nickel-dependent lactate racemase [Metabacillus sediminilitoris]QGQ46288.1 nickel-dependent lactate racemase [Metabacillus sediminilitoris]THF79339.1 nickel-dependent lactate racemase [Metabacillus sediminilitoris]